MIETRIVMIGPTEHRDADAVFLLEVKPATTCWVENATLVRSSGLAPSEKSSRSLSLATRSRLFFLMAVLDVITS